MASSHPVLGNVIEICMATRDLRATAKELLGYGIGPWKIYTFDTRINVTNGTIANRPAHFRLRVGFAQLTKDVAYEIIEPLDLESPVDIFSSWLRARSDMAGIHHIAYDCNNIPWEHRGAKFAESGAQFVQGGTWHGKTGTCQFAWFSRSEGGGSVTAEAAGSLGSTSTFFETILFSRDWEDPEPDAVIDQA